MSRWSESKGAGLGLESLALQLLNGLSHATTLFLMASGLTLIFGVTRIVNFAHGSLCMLGMYLAVWLAPRAGFWPAVAAAALAVAGWLAGREDAWARFALTLPLMLAFGFFSNLLYATMGSLLRDWLSGPVVGGVATAQRLRWFNRGMAAILVMTAAWMATF